jgi:hypothetical protein
MYKKVAFLRRQKTMSEKVSRGEETITSQPTMTGLLLFMKVQVCCFYVIMMAMAI